jgi:hypothetical protein
LEKYRENKIIAQQVREALLYAMIAADLMPLSVPLSPIQTSS